jgi:hypothetical protein
MVLLNILNILSDFLKSIFDLVLHTSRVYTLRRMVFF